MKLDKHVDIPTRAMQGAVQRREWETGDSVEARMLEGALKRCPGAQQAEKEG